MTPKWCIDRINKKLPDRVEDFRLERKGADKYPPGIIGIPVHFLGRYREFELCLTNLMFPEGTSPAWGAGQNTAKNMNDMAREMLSNDRYQWLWIIGDDHVFPPDIILQLLKADKDVIVPFCCRRKYPYIPTIHDSDDDGYGDKKWKTVDYEWFAGKDGLVSLKDTKKIAGNAGMLIKRKVFETIPDPWFEMGKIHSEYGSPDLWFAKKVIDHGFDIWLDMNHPIGHITHVAVWPYLDNDKWKAEMRYPYDVWGERGLIVD